MPLAEATALSFRRRCSQRARGAARRGHASAPVDRGRDRLRRADHRAAGLAAIQPAALLAIGTAAVWAFSTILIKTMARTESAGAITTYMAP